MLEAPNIDRRSARKAATQAEILDAAWDLVRDEGLGALSLRDLAARVGMRAPSLYSYFPSKHAIYDAMFRQGAQAILDAQAIEIDPDDIRGSVRRLARTFFDVSVADPARAQLLFQRTVPGFEPSPEAYAPAVEMVRGIHAAFEGAGITDPDAMDLFSALIGGLVSQQLANEPGGTRWARLVDRTVDMFLDHMGIEGDA